MNRKPDVIRSVVLIFVMGLVVSGVTHISASQHPAGATAPAGPQETAQNARSWDPQSS